MNALEQFLWQHHECHGQVGACVCSQIVRQPDLPESLHNLAQLHFQSFKKVLLEQVVNGQKNGTLRSDVNALDIAIEAGCMIAGLSQMALFTDKKELAQIKGTSSRWAKHYIVKQ